MVVRGAAGFAIRTWKSQSMKVRNTMQTPGTNDEAEDPPWIHVFLEITLRTLLRLHHDRLGAIDPKEDIRDMRLSRGPGVACVDERTVCNEIAYEFLTSRLAHGHRIRDNRDPEIRKGLRDWD